MKTRFAGTLILCAFALFCLNARADETTAASSSSTNTTAAATAPADKDAGQGTLAPVKAPDTKPAAPTSAVIKVNDNVNFRFGLLLQPQADFLETSSGTDGYGQNFMVRRARFMVGGQVAPKVFFFFETESGRLGNATTAGQKNWTTSFQVLDAVAEYRYSKPLNFWAGMIYLPTSREALKSSSSVFMLDQNSYAYTATTALMGTAGRDTGVMARGYGFKDRFEYRAGVFSGYRENGLRNSMRKIVRGQWNFLDTELYTLPAYPGSYFGTKKIIAVGAAYDTQNDYKGMTADLTVDLPTTFGSFVSTATWQDLDGGDTVSALPRSHTLAVDAGTYIKGYKVGPWARWEQRKYSDAINSGKDESRYAYGLNYYPGLNNFNVKFGYSVTQPKVGRDIREYIAQLQFFFY